MHVFYQSIDVEFKKNDVQSTTCIECYYKELFMLSLSILNFNNIKWQALKKY